MLTSNVPPSHLFVPIYWHMMMMSFWPAKAICHSSIFVCTLLSSTQLSKQLAGSLLWTVVHLHCSCHQPSQALSGLKVPKQDWHQWVCLFHYGCSWKYHKITKIEGPCCINYALHIFLYIYLLLQSEYEIQKLFV